MRELSFTEIARAPETSREDLEAWYAEPCPFTWLSGAGAGRRRLTGDVLVIQRPWLRSYLKARAS